MRKLVRASLLILALCCTTYAGEIPIPGIGGLMPFPNSDGNMPFPVQPTPTPEQEGTQGPAGVDVQEQGVVEGTAAKVVLDLVSGVLALF